MKILIVFAGTYSHIGRLSTHMELMGKGLKKLGHEVDYLSYSSFPRLVQILFFGGPTYVFNKLYNGLGNIYSIYILNFIFSIILLYKIYSKKYDLINAHHISSAISAALVKRLFNIPVILTIHTYYTHEMVSVGILKKDSFLEKIGIYN
ncbi:unnamed protein product [marine sediment metagenome]|uniref:Glycosyltransferase subfamily 4-like N-terminal domain-containing protein n=1 Tax=marine sediment metagenome TaxID=412755 RepID=X0Z752_9ZZZZ